MAAPDTNARARAGGTQAPPSESYDTMDAELAQREVKPCSSCGPALPLFADHES